MSPEDVKTAVMGQPLRAASWPVQGGRSIRLSSRDLGIKGTSFLRREQVAGGTVHACPTPSRLRIGISGAKRAPHRF
jgi:hypothetical protein